MDSVISGQRVLPRRKHTKPRLDLAFLRLGAVARRVPRARKAAEPGEARAAPAFRFADAPPVRAPDARDAAGPARPGRSVRRGEPSAAVVVAGLAAGFMALAMAALGVSALSYGGADLSNLELPEEEGVSAALLDFLSPELGDGSDAGPMPDLPVTLRTSEYVLGKNETLDAVSKRFGVNLDSLISLNGIGNVKRIPAGTRLKVPNINGIVHTVRAGDSISSIASRYGVEALLIIDANDLSSHVIGRGQTLFVPGARLPKADLSKALGTYVIWPLSGRMSSWFGYRRSPFTGIRQFHNGLDIVTPRGSAVKAAIAGVVAETGYSAVFGNYIILSHSGGLQTLYGHLDTVLVQGGQAVTQGMKIANSGNTGLSTGPHLHFSVFRNGTAVDPYKYLK